jgi:hypothetical protein
MHHDGDPAAHDHESDPAHTPGYGWGEEGGASHLGPATQLSAGHPAADEDEGDDSEEE